MFKWWFAEGFSFTPLWLTIQAFPSHRLLFCLIVAFTGPEINPQGILDLFTGCTNTRKIFLSQHFSTVSFNGSEENKNKKQLTFLPWAPTLELFWLFLMRHFPFSLFSLESPCCFEVRQVMSPTYRPPIRTEQQNLLRIRIWWLSDCLVAVSQMQSKPIHTVLMKQINWDFDCYTPDE